MAFTKNFIFSDAVPAQQAVQYAQLAAQQQAAEDQAFNERMRNASQANIARQNADQQRMMSQSQMQNYNQQRELDRQLQDRGYLSQQEAARIAAGPRDDAIKARTAADIAAKKEDDRKLWSIGDSFEKSVNSPDAKKLDPAVIKAMIGSGHLYRDANGMWRNRYPNPDADPNAVESFTDIQARSKPVPVPGIVVQPGKVFGSNPVPGAVVGSKIPAGMDTILPRSRMLQMGPPRFSDTVAPPSSAPIQWNDFPSYPGVRQSDIAVPFSPPAPVYIPDVPYVPVDQPWIPPSY